MAREMPQVAWPAGSPPCTQASSGRPGAVPPPRPTVPSNLNLDNFRRRRPRNRAQVAPLGPLTGHAVPAQTANSTSPRGPERLKVRRWGGASGRGWAKGPWKGRLHPAPSGAPRRLTQPGSGGPSAPPPRDPSRGRPGAGDAPRPTPPAPRAPPLGRVSRTTTAAALPRRVPAPTRGPAAHLSRGSIQLVLLVLWSM